MSALVAIRKNCVGLRRVPGIGAVLRNELHYLAIDMRIVHRLAALIPQKYGDRHSPHSLARDAPIGPRGDHVRDAFFAPRRVPLHFGDLMEGAAAHGLARRFVIRSVVRSSALRRGLHRRFHPNEPLLGGAEDHGVVATPAMWIGMLHL